MQMHADELTGQSQNSNSASAGKEEELASAGHDHLLGGVTSQTGGWGSGLWHTNDAFFLCYSIPGGGVCGASETLLFSIGAGGMGEGLISHAPIGGAGPCGPGIV